MANFEMLEKLAKSLPEVTVEPHFDKISFRIRKKIFLTYSLQNNRATVNLTKEDQDFFTSRVEKAIYPVASKWGQKGWTSIELHQVSHTILAEVVKAFYGKVVGEKKSNT